MNSKMECSDMKGALKMSKSRNQTNGTPIFVIHCRAFSLTKVNILHPRNNSNSTFKKHPQVVTLLVSILSNCYAVLYNSVCIQCVLQRTENTAPTMFIFTLC
jgi:hypothetical protein